MKMSNKVTKRRWIWICSLTLVIILIKIFSSYSQLVETIYSTKLYKAFASFIRLIFGWLPFSVGDLLYVLVILWFVWNLWRFSAKLFKRKLSQKWFANTGYKLVIIGMLVYIIFNIFWGINYNRKEISEQLNLQLSKIDTADLKIIERLLLKKVNESKHALVNQKAVYPSNKELFKRAVVCYQQAENLYPFLSYKPRSVKSSMFGLFGNYFGFTGITILLQEKRS